jgi:sugar phosphate isomerase/epimerase
MFWTLAPNVLPLRVPFERQLELAAASGFDALDLPMNHLTAGSRVWAAAEIKELYAAKGLRVGGWQLPFNYERSEAEMSAGLRRLVPAARLAGQLGSPWCFSWIEPTSDEYDYSANTRRYVRRIRAMADVLGESGCRLGLEVIGPVTLLAGHPHEFVHTLPQGLELLTEVDRPNVGLLLDSFHWYTSHASVEQLLALSGDGVVYVHVNDAVPGVDVDAQLDQVRKLPGASGLIDITAFLRAIDNIGYDGPVAVEPFDAELAATPVMERVRLAAESLRKVFGAAGLGHSLRGSGKDSA